MLHKDHPIALRHSVIEQISFLHTNRIKRTGRNRYSVKIDTNINMCLVMHESFDMCV